MEDALPRKSLRPAPSGFEPGSSGHDEATLPLAPPLTLKLEIELSYSLRLSSIFRLSTFETHAVLIENVLF